MEELKLKVGLLADEPGKSGDIKRLQNSPEKKLDSTKWELEAKEVNLNEKAGDCGRLELVLRSAQAAISRCERLMRDLAQHVYTGYTSVICAQASRYWDRVSVVLGDAQSRGEYLGIYRIRMGEDSHDLHVGEADSDEEQWGSTSPLQNIYYIIEALSPAGFL